MGDQKNRLVSLDERRVVQDRGRIEFPISAGVGLVTQSVIKYFSSSS